MTQVILVKDLPVEEIQEGPKRQTVSVELRCPEVSAEFAFEVLRFVEEQPRDWREFAAHLSNKKFPDLPGHDGLYWMHAHRLIAREVFLGIFTDRWMITNRGRDELNKLMLCMMPV